MTRYRHLRVIGWSVALVALIATGAASAQPVHQSMLPTISGAECAGPAALQRAPASASSSARTSAPSTFDDYIEDVVTAPDICGANLVTNDNVAITLGVHVHDRSSFAAADAYRIHLDTDSNPSTGSLADSGPLVGTDFVIDVTDETSILSAWNGSSFAAVAPQPEVLSGWADGYGPAVLVPRAALGNPQAFNIALTTANAVDHDFAPDSGWWSYVVAPLRLTAGRLTLSRARAGLPLLAAMEVERSDFEIPLDEGTIACRGSLAGKKLSCRGLFAGDQVACTWRLPKSAKAKRLSGSVSVTFQGVTAKRSFGLRVK
jgi:hypothetical protein